MSRPTRILHVLNYGWPHVDGYTIRSAGLLGAQASHPAFDPRVVLSPFGSLTRSTDRDFRTVAWSPDDQRRPAGRGPLPWERPGIGLAPVTHRRFREGLAALLRGEPVDVVHAHHPHYVGRPAQEAARAAGLPFVYEVRCFNGDYDAHARHPWIRFRGRRFNALELRLCGDADAVVVISERQRDRLVAGGVDAARVHVVRNAVDTARFAPAEASGAHGTRDLAIGYATTFERMEGLDLLLDAVARLRDRDGGSTPRVCLAGDGRDRERIAARVRTLGLEDTVTLPGFLPVGAMPDFYRSLDLFVVPRRPDMATAETTPLKPLEALACGVPVLAHDLPGLRDLLAPLDGVRFCDPTPDALANALDGFRRAPWTVPAGGRLAGRTWAREVRRYEAVYEAVRGRPTAATAP